MKITVNGVPLTAMELDLLLDALGIELRQIYQLKANYDKDKANIKAIYFPQPRLEIWGIKIKFKDVDRPMVEL